MAWLLPTPWDWTFIALAFLTLSAFVFWRSLGAYMRISGRAFEIAGAKALSWLILYGGSFSLVFALVSHLVPDGVWRYGVGSLVWFGLTQTLLAWGWALVGRFIDQWLL